MSASGNDSTPPVIDTSRPHPARMYDWFLGGKDNYPVDEAMGCQVLAVEPSAPLIAKVNRAFMRRATRWAADQGIRQFLDIGTGIPTEPNLHQVAQRVAPESRVVYVDNDPIVLAHAAALLRGSSEGALDYIQAHAQDTATILERAAKTLDFDRPVALSLVALLHFLTDDDGAHDVVEHLLAALAPGSCLTISHITADFLPDQAEQVSGMYNANAIHLTPRTKAEFARFFEGLDFVEPGISPAQAWRPELGEPVPGQEDIVTGNYVAVARKP
ncbi:SAM-dependent methyltransferase [Streptomyces sp. YIM S03343]